MSQIVESRRIRAKKVNRLIKTIASCGRGFWGHNTDSSGFWVDDRGLIWWRDAYRNKPQDTRVKGAWRNFSDGGTLLALAKDLRGFIMTGKALQGSITSSHWGYSDEARTQVENIALVEGILEARR